VRPQRRHRRAGRRRLAAEVGPRLHQATSLFERIAAPVGLLDPVAGRVRQGGFANFARKIRRFAGPIAKARSETVHRDVVVAERL